jgi:outer membrane protein assembly factor BamD (BamD/ComL family)
MSSRLTILLFAMLSVPAFAQKETDTVQLKDGNSKKGQIQAEDFRMVKIAGEEIPWSKVDRVIYSDAPSELQQATDAEAQGDFAQAAQLLAPLAESAKGKPAFKQQALIALARVQLRQGQNAEAVKSATKYLEQYGAARGLREALTVIVAAGMAEGKKDEAKASLEKLKDTLKAKHPGAVLWITIAQGDLARLAGDYPTAKTMFDSIEANKSADADATLREQAVLGNAQVMLAQGKGADAESKFRELSQKSESEPVLIAAWNGLGDIYKKRAEGDQSTENALEALMAYLHGVVLYAPGPSEPGEPREEALFGAADSFRLLATREKDEETRNRHVARAKENFQVLLRDFPSTPHRKDAEAKLQSLAEILKAAPKDTKAAPKDAKDTKPAAGKDSKSPPPKGKGN